MEGISRSNNVELDSSKYDANRTLIIRVFCESRARDDQLYRANGEVLLGELNLVLLPGIETLNLEPTSSGVSKEASQLGRGITSFYRSVSSLSQNQFSEDQINWRLTKLLHFLHHAMLPTSFTVLLAFLNPLRSHRSLALQTLALAHRIRKIAQTPAPCRIHNQSVVSSFLRDKVKAAEEANEELKRHCGELKRHCEELQEELQTAKASFTSVSVALDQANEKGEKDSEELKKCREQIEAIQSAEQLRSLRIVTLE